MRRVSELLDISLTVRLQSGENRVKLAGFKEQKKKIIFIKPPDLQ
jgi:hypothetical protein